MFFNLSRRVLTKKKIVLFALFLFSCFFLFLFLFKNEEKYTFRYYYEPAVERVYARTEEPGCWKLRFPLWMIRIMCPGYKTPTPFFVDDESYPLGGGEVGRSWLVFLLDMPSEKRRDNWIKDDPRDDANLIQELRIKYSNDEGDASQLSSGTYKIGTDYMEINDDSFYYTFPFTHQYENDKLTISAYRLEQGSRQLVAEKQFVAEKGKRRGEIDFELDFGSYEFDIKLEYQNRSGEFHVLEEKVGIYVMPTK